MLLLLSSNPAKYAPFRTQLERLRLELRPPSQPLPEVQTLSFAEALAEKARTAAALSGHPVLVDDAGLTLEAYRPFPGPLTSTVLRSIGATGLRRLLNGVSHRAAMECHLGCWSAGRLQSWRGRVEGHLDFSRPVRDERMMLTDLFVPDGNTRNDGLAHRARALEAFAADAWELHLEIAAEPLADHVPCARAAAYECPFCAEFENNGSNIYAQLMGSRLASRVVYEDEHFGVVPPLGEFMEGGLLVLTRQHMLSLACLPQELYTHLERLMDTISKAVRAQYGVAPLVFEHGPAPEWSKGVCCVDHAHLNVFPATVEVHARLLPRMNLTIEHLADLRRLRAAEFGYLFVQENDGTRRAYDGEHVPTQLVRRIITSSLGLAERWHWRDYPGLEELLATYHALKGNIRP